VTSGISRCACAQYLRGAHRGKICVRVFIGVSVRACCERLRCTVSFSIVKLLERLFNVFLFLAMQNDLKDVLELLSLIAFPRDHV
jgi:hypothetical protein